ncbi:hypothetical protein [Psychrobacter faecalis]|uniref:hypothetical protein n=1 Tax=Psychrobacter faecalis TaxID=180588 RepID=UPI003FD52637
MIAIGFSRPSSHFELNETLLKKYDIGANHMQKMLLALSVAFLGQTTIAHATTDWTPFLKPMLSGCSVPIPTKDLPTRYKSSIVSKKAKVDSDYADSGFDGNKITTYYLKDATAFGQPLSKVEYTQGFEDNQLKLYFKDTKFTALRPQFQLPEIDELEDGYIELRRNNASGYDIRYMGYTGLKFDTKQKSIACYGGA